MAFETPKTDWKPESVPTEEDFNRIESNIKTLEDTKEPKIDILPVDKGGTGANSFQEDCFIIGNNGNAFKTLSKAEASVGHAQRATCDENGNNIAGTYLGTSKTPLCIDAVISYLNPIKLSEYIGNYKYLIFLLKSEGGSSFFMIDREIFVGFFNQLYPLVLESNGKKIFLFYEGRLNSIISLLPCGNLLLTVYGLN